jgi:ATP-dependent Clp protease ATP-binding subunit ClpA
VSEHVGVMGERPASDELQGYDPSARRAVALAETEARELGHDRVGTEHLLLGLAANEGSEAASALFDAGVTLAAARRKVSEAVGPTSGAPTARGPLERTPRAERALARAVRFSHARRADLEGTEHVLLGVLDVEGTAGQVLRGLGVDVERLRSALEAGATTPHEQVIAPSTPRHVPSRCPQCGSDIDGSLVARMVTALADDGQPFVDAVVFTCGTCGIVLGVSKL